ncbi:16S rRNA (guanine(527)-N(7))-methyltransferase RsmG [Rhodohalobacter sp. 614A]|uniref:16S rRNA (guanine(527)-N(7))-methyltransferase RsmG n=1 Tax=Rhodohalobacter sp. 614A TaxID=2908649 RepID=UPI001F02B9DD
MKHSINTVEVDSEVLFKARKLYSAHNDQLEKYIDLLLEWNEKINLVSRNVSRETVREHVVHSLLPIPLGLVQWNNKWIDSGTGGGLPGIPLAICEKEKEWHLNDNVRKKMRAVEDISQSMGLENVEVIAKSISLIQLEKGTGIVTKHAFKIKDLLKHLDSQPWETILMWKGVGDVEEEVRRSRENLHVTIYAFDFGKDEPFYEGKGIVKIEK